MARKNFKTYKVENIDRELKWFKTTLKRQALSDNTIDSYVWTLRDFLNTYNGVVSVDNFLNYKGKKMEENAPTTVNNRIHALNRYGEERELNFHLKDVHIQTSQYIENVISMADYKRLKSALKKDEDWNNYFLVWAMASTGARVSEVVQIKVEYVYDGPFQIYGKGMKYRTIFMPKQFQEECKKWIESTQKEDGYLFVDNNGNRLDRTKVEYRVKKLAYKYHINPAVMHPHSFRHLFGKTFYEKTKNLVLTKDLMGHASIATTAIYCKPSFSEMVEMYHSIVKW